MYTAFKILVLIKTKSLKIGYKQIKRQIELTFLVNPLSASRATSIQVTHFRLPYIDHKNRPIGKRTSEDVTSHLNFTGVADFKL